MTVNPLVECIQLSLVLYHVAMGAYCNRRANPALQRKAGNEMNYACRAYKTTIGWSWAIRNGWRDVVRGGGDPSEATAWRAMNFKLQTLEHEVLGRKG